MHLLILTLWDLMLIVMAVVGLVMAVVLVVTLLTIQVAVVLAAIQATVVIKETYRRLIVAAQQAAATIQVHTDLVQVVV